jgi:hypothetical protein
MTTVLTEFSTTGNSRTSTVSGHTAIQPKLVIEKRRVPEGNQVISEYSCKVIYATTDADDTVISNKVSFEAIIRYPVIGDYDDVTAALAIFRDILAGDEFANSISTQEWL